MIEIIEKEPSLVTLSHLGIFESIIKYVEENNSYYYSNLEINGSEEYVKLKKIAPHEKASILESLILFLNELDIPLIVKERKHYLHARSDKYCIAEILLSNLMKFRIDFPEDYDFRILFSNLYMYCENEDGNLLYTKRPLGGFVNQIEKHVKRNGLTPFSRLQIQDLIKGSAFGNILKGAENLHTYDLQSLIKSAKKLSGLLLDKSDSTSEVPIYQFGSGPMGRIFNDSINGLESKSKWHTLFYHLSCASGGKPNKKFIIGVNPLIDDIGKDNFKSLANFWFEKLSRLKVETEVKESICRNQTYTYEIQQYIEHYSHNVIKGLLWSMSRFHDQRSLKNIALVAEKCFQKIPGVGPAAAGIGNAAIYTLAQSKGLNGISHLSRLKLSIKQNNTQKLIQNYIDEQALKQGIKSSQIEEIAASDFGLINAVRIEKFEDYTFQLSITKVGEVLQQWIKPDGSIQKTLPKFIKDSAKLSEKLKKLKDIAKQIKQSSSTQRDRIDRLYTENLKWNREDFEKYYLNHGLISVIANKLIWNIDGQPFMYIDTKWVNTNKQEITLHDDAVIQLWHPIDSETHCVLAWRDFLEEQNIKQPFKQAYREIYLLTDAEINTRIYSNRMAGHILKQHQFNSLAATRGWKYSLLGCYDDGRDGEIASKKIPDSNLTAQFWINEIIDDTDSFNEAGIWYYIATDQIRFINELDEPVELIDIPPLVLTEIMRDVDLFVGVASVGNDPAWQDGGPDARPEYRDYWQSYSFGDLTEIAKTRKSVLERLIPRLKIKDKVTIDGKFLLVTGTKHTYKIHIGSGNILIAPQDSYLCIVPGRGKDSNVDKLFLPFEGDNGLSIVLSKAFLLVADDKITDPTILSQL
ncbi:MAG: DUF4132 domain-containing protein [Saccharospirillaceae bacterium]|nr:DUF4132 domain-containing protein [Pseudomonadales bacterium]NRB81219.1 DUF4132 domain-containing protein [Saccharospirillaceae bacterium]